MNTLTIDIGNSRIKVDSWSDDGLIGREFEGEWNTEGVLKAVESLDIMGIIIGSVRKDNHQFIKDIRENFKGIFVEFNDEEIRQHYTLSQYHGPLGPDRFAAFLGAKMFFGNQATMIVDLGTAITIDIADNKGEFCGGNISLGLEGRLNALTQSTGRLPKVEALFPAPSFGTDTATAIRAGVFNGIRGEIIYSAELAKDIFDIKYIISTGGDADKIKISNIGDIRSFHDKYLVGRGLDYHLREKCMHLPIGLPRL